MHMHRTGKTDERNSTCGALFPAVTISFGIELARTLSFVLSFFFLSFFISSFVPSLSLGFSLPLCVIYNMCVYYAQTEFSRNPAVLAPRRSHMMTSRRFSFLKNGLEFSEVQRPRHKINKLGDSSCEKCYDTQDMSCPFFCGIRDIN